MALSFNEPWSGLILTGTSHPIILLWFENAINSFFLLGAAFLLSNKRNFFPFFPESILLPSPALSKCHLSSIAASHLCTITPSLRLTLSPPSTSSVVSYPLLSIPLPPLTFLFSLISVKSTLLLDWHRAMLQGVCFVLFLSQLGRVLEEDAPFSTEVPLSAAACCSLWCAPINKVTRQSSCMIFRQDNTGSLQPAQQNLAS